MGRSAIRLASYGGNVQHAPSHTRVGLLSAYTGGADVLEIGVQLSHDGQLVAFPTERTAAATGVDVAVADLSLEELRELDFGAMFCVPGSAARPWQKDPPEARIETLGGLLDQLPGDAILIVQAVVTRAATARDLTTKIITTLSRRGAITNTILVASDLQVLATARLLAPELRTGYLHVDGDRIDDLQRGLLERPHLLTISWQLLLNSAFRPTALALDLKQRHEQGEFPGGVLIRSPAADHAHTKQLLQALASLPFVFAVSAPSMVHTASLVRSSRMREEQSFAGEQADPGRIRFGYAKANPYAHVYQDDGVHVEIRPFDDQMAAEEPTDDPVAARLDALQEALWFAAGNWPFYSGGGFGTVLGIDGDFTAEVDFSAAIASQATMLEMAAVNVQPGKHRPGWKLGADGEPIHGPDGRRVPNVPASFRDKDSFFDPHGAPPFVGVEHDEDDGYRINHNLGSAYDHNRYGRPLGDGRTLHGRLRLERRGAYFSAYYQDEQNTDWVCVGACRNDSMNRRVFLRCAGKRWRQERDEPKGPEGPFFPIVANHFIFKNFMVWTPLPGSGVTSS